MGNEDSMVWFTAKWISLVGNLVTREKVKVSTGRASLYTNTTHVACLHSRSMLVMQKGNRFVIHVYLRVRLRQFDYFGF